MAFIAFRALPSSGQGAEAVGLDEDFSFSAFVGADLCAEVVVGAEEPFAVPAVLVDDSKLLLGFADVFFRLSFKAAVLGDGGKLATGVDKKGSDKDRLGDLAILIGCGLEALAGSVREAVEVEAVVPVGAADKREAVWSKALQGVVEAALEVFVERLF